MLRACWLQTRICWLRARRRDLRHVRGAVAAAGDEPGAFMAPAIHPGAAGH